MAGGAHPHEMADTHGLTAILDDHNARITALEGDQPPPIDPPVSDAWFSNGRDTNTQAFFTPLADPQLEQLPGYSGQIEFNITVFTAPLFRAAVDDSPRVLEAFGNNDDDDVVTITYWPDGAQALAESEGQINLLMPNGRTLYELYGARPKSDPSKARFVNVYDVVDGSGFHAVEGWPGEHPYNPNDPKRGTRAGKSTWELGMIRPWHITGEPMQNALVVAFSNGLLGPPAMDSFIHPAMDVDENARTAYEGVNPMGTRISTDIDLTSQMRSEAGQTIAATLTRFGAYCMDRASAPVTFYGDPALADVLRGADWDHDRRLLAEHIQKVV